MNRISYWCSCAKASNISVDYESKRKHTKMYETLVTGDRLCVHCEHYAMASPFRPKYDGTLFDIDSNTLTMLSRDEYYKTAERKRLK